MFGYLTIYKPELKFKEFYKYKAYYCGLCRTLKEEYGFSGQMTLTYDMTFVIILLTSLYECGTTQSLHHCKVHPVKKIPMLQNEMTDYCADMNMVLSYYHLLDDWKDEKSIPGLAGMKLLNKNVGKIIHTYKKKCGIIQDCLRRLSECEKQGVTDIDKVSGCFGDLMGELLVYKEDTWEPVLRRMGFFLGKFIYLLDAYDDLEKDIKKKNYNPLKPLYGEKDYEEHCRELLLMMMAECSSEFEKLPCIQDEEILRNILYAGVWTKYNKIQKELNEGKEQNNGQQPI